MSCMWGGVKQKMNGTGVLRKCIWFKQNVMHFQRAISPELVLEEGIW
jgi:hypothetical protein